MLLLPLTLFILIPRPTVQWSVYNMSRNLGNFFFGALGPEIDMSTGGIIRARGYEMETHHVITEDGYELELHRIPRGKTNLTTTDKYPVIVFHGNFQTSADWVLNSPDSEALGFFLADEGYDVWLSNQRGNEYSSRHKVFAPGSSKYWNFSFHEMGYFDLPATVDYVTKTTNKKKVHYIGFSMGTTAFFAGLSSRPEYSEKIGVGIAMGPSTFQDHFLNAWVKLVAPAVWFIQMFRRYAGDMPVLPVFVTKLLHKVLPIFCHPKVDLLGICLNFVLISFGQDKGKITKERLHRITNVSPSSSPMKAFIHEMQLMGTGRFCEYDYGTEQNMIIYGAEHPPDYNLTNVRAPIALMVGLNDFLAHREDAKTLASKLPNLIDFYYVDYEHFTHLDFIYSDARDLVYKHIIKLMARFDNT